MHCPPQGHSRHLALPGSQRGGYATPFEIAAADSQASDTRSVTIETAPITLTHPRARMLRLRPSGTTIPTTRHSSTTSRRSSHAQGALSSAAAWSTAGVKGEGPPEGPGKGLHEQRWAIGAVNMPGLRSDPTSTSTMMSK
jgi:hypothetical protein